MVPRGGDATQRLQPAPSSSDVWRCRLAVSLPVVFLSTACSCPDRRARRGPLNHGRGAAADATAAVHSLFTASGRHRIESASLFWCSPDEPWVSRRTPPSSFLVTVICPQPSASSASACAPPPGLQQLPGEGLALRVSAQALATPPPPRPPGGSSGWRPGGASDRSGFTRRSVNTCRNQSTTAPSTPRRSPPGGNGCHRTRRLRLVRHRQGFFIGVRQRCRPGEHQAACWRSNPPSMPELASGMIQIALVVDLTLNVLAPP